jgi:hypothetical protein
MKLPVNARGRAQGLGLGTLGGIKAYGVHRQGRSCSPVGAVLSLGPTAQR